jgi:hypothetical protein
MQKSTRYILIALALVFAYPAFWFLRELKYILIGDNSYEMQLIIAAKENDIPRAQALLAKGANINVVKSFLTSTTPLNKAIQYGNIEMVDFLLQHGAKTDIKADHLPLDLAEAIANHRHELITREIPSWEQVVQNQPKIIRLLKQAGAQSSID